MIEALIEWLAAVAISVAAPTQASTAACASCHADAAAGHGASRHAVAWTNAIFQAEYREHPKPWCVSCHAPAVLPADRDDPPAELAADGVGCVACHVSGGRITVRSRRPSQRAGSFHEIAVEPTFGSARQCAICHQFDFPVLDGGGRSVGSTGVPMQNTVAENRAAGAGECIGCHSQGDDRHRFPGSHDPEMVRAAVAVELCRDASGLELRVENRGAGHNLPTGGVHRFMVARVWRSSTPARLVELRLGRDFDHRTDSGKRTARDTTIPPGQSRSLRINLEALGGTAAEPLNLELRYVYTLDEHGDLADGSPASRVIVDRRSDHSDLPACGALAH